MRPFDGIGMVQNRQASSQAPDANRTHKTTPVTTIGTGNIQSDIPAQTPQTPRQRQEDLQTFLMQQHGLALTLTSGLPQGWNAVSPSVWPIAGSSLHPQAHLPVQQLQHQLPAQLQPPSCAAGMHERWDAMPPASTELPVQLEQQPPQQLQVRHAMQLRPRESTATRGSSMGSQRQKTVQVRSEVASARKRRAESMDVPPPKRQKTSFSSEEEDAQPVEWIGGTGSAPDPAANSETSAQPAQSKTRRNAKAASGSAKTSTPSIGAPVLDNLEYRFGGGRVRLSAGPERKLFIDDIEEKVEGRNALAVLAALIQLRHRVVRYEELKEMFWPDQEIESAPIHWIIASVRPKLDKVVKGMIVCTSGKGYQFTGALDEDTQTRAESAQAPADLPAIEVEYRFGRFCFKPGPPPVLLVNGQANKQLDERHYKVLTALIRIRIQNPERAVPASELAEAACAGRSRIISETFVAKKIVPRLREVLGKETIEKIVNEGYQFAGVLEGISQAGAAPRTKRRAANRGDQPSKKRKTAEPTQAQADLPALEGEYRFNDATADTGQQAQELQQRLGAPLPDRPVEVIGHISQMQQQMQKLLREQQQMQQQVQQLPPLLQPHGHANDRTIRQDFRDQLRGFDHTAISIRDRPNFELPLVYQQLNPGTGKVSFDFSDNLAHSAEQLSAWPSTTSSSALTPATTTATTTATWALLPDRPVEVIDHISQMQLHQQQLPPLLQPHGNANHPSERLSKTAKTSAEASTTQRPPFGIAQGLLTTTGTQAGDKLRTENEYDADVDADAVTFVYLQLDPGTGEVSFDFSNDLANSAEQPSPWASTSGTSAFTPAMTTSAITSTTIATIAATTSTTTETEADDQTAQLFFDHYLLN